MNIINIISYLKWWNHNGFGNIQQHIKDIEDKLIKQQILVQEYWSFEYNIEYKRLFKLHQIALSQEERF